jgi:hypothetical protein
VSVLSLNEEVSFDMTAEGTRVYREYLRNLRLEKYENDYITGNPYKWPLWQVMQVFGPHTFMGMSHDLIERNEVRLKDKPSP